MSIRRGLGRGLGALLASEPSEAESLLELPKMAELAQSMLRSSRPASSSRSSSAGLPGRISSLPASGAGAPPSRRASIGFRRSFATRPTRKASSWPSLRTCCARTSTRSRPRRPTRSSSPSSGGLRRSWPSGSARTARRSPTPCASCASRRRSRPTCAAGGSRWATRGRSSH